MKLFWQLILIGTLVGSITSTPIWGQEKEKKPAPTPNPQPPTPNPVTLEDAVAIALRSAPRLQAASSLTEAARQHVNVAQAERATQLFGMSGYEIATRHQIPQGFTTRLGVKKTFYDGGQTRALVEQAKANVNSLEAQHASAQQDVVLSVKQAFYKVLFSQEWAKLKQQTVVRVQGTMELAQALFDKGQVPERDIIQAKANLANARIEAADAESQVNAAKSELRSAMGLAWDEPLEIAGALTPAEKLPDLKTFIEQATPNHPELQRAQADVLAAEAAVRAAESQRKPMVNLNSTVGVQDKTLPPTRGVFLFNVIARFPIADGGQTKAEIAEAKAALASAQATLSQIKLDVERRVKQAWYLAQSAQQRIDAAEEAIPPAQESLRLAEAQYRAGVGTLLNVKDAQVTLLNVLTNRTNAIYQYRLAEAQLQHAAGLLEEGAKKLQQSTSSR